MFFVDKPYVSELFKNTVRENGFPVVGTDIAKECGLHSGTNVISEKSAIEIIKESDNPSIYTTSENSISWISKHLAFSNLPEKINLFKNKLKFRELTKSMSPNYFYQEVKLENINYIKFDLLPLPFIIKPVAGFFSMGVYKVTSLEEWNNTKKFIVNEIEQIKDLYPNDVLDTNSFIIEQYIAGEEYAFDAYFNSNGEPVILSIMKHLFSSENDVSDRVYITSKKIIEDNLLEFTDFTKNIGDLAKVKNFPVHIELRRDSNGKLFPIEVNPLRFGGWCTTADISFFAYGFNPYSYYYLQKTPNWSDILKDKEGKIFSVIVLDNSTGIEVNKIDSFDFDKLLSNFEKPIELRKVDFNSYPLFGFLFTETREDNLIELNNILNSDLVEYITEK